LGNTSSRIFKQVGVQLHQHGHRPLPPQQPQVITREAGLTHRFLYPKHQAQCGLVGWNLESLAALWNEFQFRLARWMHSRY
jgi:hypothetical protein